VKEAAYVGALLVIAIIFIFLRNVRSTLIICTSIPISVIGTFALLYFAGFTLNIMTFGGLALGIGMVVDASIVVLENAFRHMEHGKPHAGRDRWREEVWSAILASTLTHIAVFVPLLFLTGVSSILFVQLSIVVMFSLTMSLFVAVTVVPVLCSRVLKMPVPVEERKGFTGRMFTVSERALEGLDNGYRALIHRALGHRLSVIGLAAGLPRGVFHPPGIQPGRGPTKVKSISARLASGTRIERSEQIAQRPKNIRGNVPEDRPHQFGRHRRAGRIVVFVSITVKLALRRAPRSNDVIANDLRWSRNFRHLDHDAGLGRQSTAHARAGRRRVEHRLSVSRGEA
jgi:HAE1 family hydrophobic/amphiphilic exporter-1